ncbi:MAG TPA: glycoside hydrolase family 20 zincin-like fold domain-containing protein [Bryobacteraceae bacterium]|nr:glycoside hydrolase family 20 zincin-like fold domain-containing protein [Bryobacteraceae bacterium]
MMRAARTGISILLSLVPPAISAFAASPLYVRGYSVIPEPQRVELRGGDLAFDNTWRLDTPQGVPAGDIAIEELKAQLAERYRLSLGAPGQGKSVELLIRPGAVEIGAAADRDRAALAEQAYRLQLGHDRIRIIANAPPGLFYGVETLVQLVKPERGKLWLPEADITDWPDVAFREIFWDELEHLDHFDVLQQAIRRAAFFKINMFTLRLNQHFEHASAPALVDPYAISPAQLQHLTDFGLRYHVEVIPYLDGPAHVNFILEHEEYARLREFPETAFQMCSTNPETYKLLEGMYQDLIDANKGVKYFHLSTDEAWFIGKADNDQCREAERAKLLGSPSKLWVEYTKKTASYLEAHGRKVIFWGEDPLQAEDIPLLPSSLINGEVYSTMYNKAFREHGIRQIIYTNSLPDDPLFPYYSVLSPSEQVHPAPGAEERATTVFNEISFTSARQEADIAGVGIYAWGDLGPHPETYWLGYAVGASAAWHPGSPDPHELAQRFYRLYYGPGTIQMGRLYQLMSAQAQFFATSWDSQPSGPVVFGYSYGIGPFTPHSSTLPLPPVPTPDYLRLGHRGDAENARRVELAWKFLGENDELMNLLYENLASAEFNRYNLEVYLSIAKLFRHNLLLLKELAAIHKSLESAEENAAKLKYAEAVAALDQALDTAGRIRDERNQALHQVTATWYETWFPRVREANGRHVAREPQSFVDTASTESAKRRQEGLLYLIDREFSLPFGDWVDQVQQARNQYAAGHKLPIREGRFDWQDTTTLHSQGINREL